MDVVGLDRSAAFPADAGDGRCARADARRLPFPPGAFDAAVCLCQGGFGLLGGPGDLRAFAALAGCVRPGGRVAVSELSSYSAVRHLEEGETFDAAEGVLHEVATVRSPAGDDLWTTCFTPGELLLLAAVAGLEVDGLWSVAPGRYGRRPPHLEHPEWLLVATRCAGRVTGGGV